MNDILIKIFYFLYICIKTDIICRIEDCEVCGKNKAKYTCPKCEVRTCCLECVNIHKKELECDGIRDKTKFIPLKSFTDLDILSGKLC